VLVDPTRLLEDDRGFEESSEQDLSLSGRLANVVMRDNGICLRNETREQRVKGDFDNYTITEAFTKHGSGIFALSMGGEVGPFLKYYGLLLTRTDERNAVCEYPMFQRVGVFTSYSEVGMGDGNFQLEASRLRGLWDSIEATSLTIV